MATETVKIFSNKAFRFDHPADKSLSVTVRPGFDDVPEWVKESAMYKLADKDGDVMEIKTREDEVAAEKGGAKKKAGSVEQTV